MLKYKSCQAKLSNSIDNRGSLQSCMYYEAFFSLKRCTKDLKFMENCVVKSTAIESNKFFNMPLIRLLIM